MLYLRCARALGIRSRIGARHLHTMPTSAASARHLHTSTAGTIDRLRATLSEEVPLCTGIVPLAANISQLFYRNAEDGSLGFIDFSTVVSDAQLERLAQACQPATFGLQQQDVLDESYRKAGKMDAVNFSTNFNPSNTGIMQAVDCLLLKNPQSSIQVELHKLNVYGPGSFFKAHVDTPRNGKMFGSLVVVLPTKHEGGALPLRHHGREWVFNSADMVSPQNSDSGPRAAFVAFFGDIEHEVTVVKSGYRVTLTYNLYFGDNKPTTIVPSMLPVDDTELKIKRSLTTLLNDRTFLPDGGLLGFSLSHLYPISRDTNLDELGKSLKGTDAAIKRACDSLSLEVSVNGVYTGNDDCVEGIACLLHDIPHLGETEVEDEDLITYLQETSSTGLVVFDPDKISLEVVTTCGFKDARPIVWLKPLTKMNQIECPYVRYGNEPSLDYVYGEICLVLEVQSFNDRETYDF